MKNFFVIACSAVFVLSFLAAPVEASENVSAKSFAGADEMLEEHEVALYLAYHADEPLSKFLAPGQLSLDIDMLVAAMQDNLDDLQSLTGHDAPWTWQELDSLAIAKKRDDQKKQGWKKITGVTVAEPLGENGDKGSLGPIRLRKSGSELAKALRNAKGTSIGFSDNRVSNGGGAWNTQGALGYPVKFFFQHGPGKSTEFEITPMFGWNLAEAEGKAEYEVNELDFSLPVIVYISPGRNKMTGTYEENISAAGDHGFSRLWIVTAKPYFQTDFGFRHEIYGIEASAEYVGYLFGSKLYFGGFQNIASSGLQYQLRVIPRVDYSETAKGGIHTTRQEGDDWFRLGGQVALDFRIGEAYFNSLDIGTSYQFFEALSGQGGYSDLFNTYATWWLSENAGMTLEYSKGNTPVAAQKIDLVILGLEFKY